MGSTSGQGVYFGDNENVLKLDDGDFCTTLEYGQPFLSWVLHSQVQSIVDPKYRGDEYIFTEHVWPFSCHYSLNNRV